MLKTIKLYGILAKKFGKEFRLEVASVREVMRALSVQLPGFEKFMLHAHEHGLAFAVWQDKRNIAASEIDMHTDADVIKIVPRVIGAGGAVQAILGAVLIVVGAVLTFTGVAAPLGAALIGAGVGMLIGGIAMMLMPKIENEDQNQDGNKANRGFGGAVTTVAQGNPVPVLRGCREIGGFVVSAGQYPEDLM
jgi:predicted phage tail protein